MATLFQKKYEVLKDYTTSFCMELKYINNPQDESILTAISVGLDKSGKLYCSIYKTPIKALQDFYDQVTIDIIIEESLDDPNCKAQRNQARTNSRKGSNTIRRTSQQTQIPYRR